MPSFLPVRTSASVQALMFAGPRSIVLAMSERHLLHGLPARLALLLVLALALTAACAQELVVNGNFARGGDPPPGWVRDRETARKGTIRVVDGVVEMAPNSANTPGSSKP